MTPIAAYPMQHRIKAPVTLLPYTRSEATDIRKTMEAERARLKTLEVAGDSYVIRLYTRGVA